MTRRGKIVLAGTGAALAFLYLANASWAAHPSGRLNILSHRGVHQIFGHEGLTSATCTAARIEPPVHPFLENTIPSMKAAFDDGADMVEIDVHPTTDGTFAVFHDWTVDCRTDGHGVTRDMDMAALKALDIGYGYTADGGRTFPFRGKGIGLMPSLDEVLRAFPGRRFLVNFKSADPHEGALMAAWLKTRPWADARRLAFYGDDRPVARLKALRPDLRTMSGRSAKSCAKSYLLLGWSGYVPAACRHTIVMAPRNLAWIAWGWPNRFLERMQRADTDVYMIGTVDLRHPGLSSLDTPDDLKALPAGWRGGVATEKIEVVGALLKRRS
ncbi:MAG TPA: glycerophosphodiester phosphodiesterase family protein [Allosphingosinicella sp.]|jgi:glycerophosphoryl diester phosphodiesterase